MCGLQICRQALLAEGGLQALLQHLHQLLLPVIRAATMDDSQDPCRLLPNEKADCKQLLGMEQEDLDMLLAVLEKLAAADATSTSHATAQVTF